MSFLTIQAGCLGPNRGASSVELNNLRYRGKEKLKVFPTSKSSCINQLNYFTSLLKGECPKAHRPLRYYDVIFSSSWTSDSWKYLFSPTLTLVKVPPYFLSPSALPAPLHEFLCFQLVSRCKVYQNDGLLPRMVSLTPVCFHKFTFWKIRFSTVGFY